MKKTGNIIFVAACLVLCLLPFVGMVKARTNSTTENRQLASFPKVKEDGKWNREWLLEAGTYFEEHFAFRPYLVTADSEIMSRIFGVSNMDTVIDGKNGWLYYTATLDDYLGAKPLSERGLYNICHNLSIMQRYVEENGAKFLFTVAPNKNSLYGEQMPYYADKKVSGTKNMKRLEPALLKEKIPYADLFRVFEDQKDILYLKRDSHWNQKGAVLAYNSILDALGVEHETYETVPSVRTKTEYGDLNLMLYPKSAVPEWNYKYENESSYQYETDSENVEDAWIHTSNKNGRGSLLMFRDSFGNTLLPLMADTFQDGYFSKSVPYPVEEYISEYHPEKVIVEKVERNLKDLALDPPIMAGLPIKIKEEPRTADTDTTLYLRESEYDMSYWEIGGILDEKYVKNDTNVYVTVRCGDYDQTCEAFTVTKKESDKESDNGYLLYVPKVSATADSFEVCVMAETKGNIIAVKKETFNNPAKE